ncbi:DUF4168 domain-containing protein [Aequorivita marina]|uniref:DUF4168 domain-containing protein n=1 Tax=Aequorivita marina TaxID=3073654 RepID=UPI00287595F5|nr:DUF4168 domain-containing protein [Aequorivita sp. S2608]MDS1299767.1 DUF4168 domain-containing protein [Aequorivita sp. S2608]
MFKSVKIKSVFLFVAMMGTFGLFAQETTVSDAELTQFANAYQEMQMQNQQAQQQMVKIIEDEGMDVQRFSTIQQASMDPNQEVDATVAEMKMHGNAIAKMEKLQPELEKKASEKIAATGLSMERFEALAAQIQQDQALQQRLQAILMKNQG